MGSNNSRNRQKKREIKSSVNKNRMKFIGGALALGIMAVVPVMEYHEQQQEKRIGNNANIDAIRNFRNIKQNNMGEYLKSEIERLYEKYPDLDNIILNEAEETGKIEFLDDIYRLYKAFMVDKSEKEVDIDDVKVKRRDQIILQSDSIAEEDKKITKTHKEQYKMITDSFVKAKESGSEIDGAQLAKRIYELLALELGVKDDVLTSEELQEEVEKEGFYYDMKNNIVYTGNGRGHVVFDKIYDKGEQTEEQVEEQEEAMTKKEEGMEH